jgi:hypothetical protein
MYCRVALGWKGGYYLVRGKRHGGKLYLTEAVSYELVDTETSQKMKAGSAVLRAGVGSALLGPAGLLLAAGAKKKTTRTFVVRLVWSETRETLIEFTQGDFSIFEMTWKGAHNE